MKALYLWAVVLVAVVLAAFSLAGPATQLGWHLAGRVTATAEPLRAPAGGDAGAGATGSVNAIQALAPFGSSAPAPASPDSGDVSDIAGLGLTLRGVLVDSDASRSRAFIARNGRTSAYLLGDDVAEGVLLTEIAGLTTQDDVISLAMRQTERVLSWAFDGAHIGEKAAPKATSAMRLDVFRQQYTMILRATEALMPYMAPKATPDQVVNQNVQVVVSSGPTGAADPAATARDVTPKAPRRTGRMMPADAAHEMQQNQQVSGSTGDGSDGTGRTE